MFTGIVQGLCRVISVADASGVRRLQIDLGNLAGGLVDRSIRCDQWDLSDGDVE